MPSVTLTDDQVVELVKQLPAQELLDELTDKLRSKLAFTDEQLAETLNPASRISSP